MEKVESLRNEVEATKLAESKIEDLEKEKKAKQNEL